MIKSFSEFLASLNDEDEIKVDGPNDPADDEEQDWPADDTDYDEDDADEDDDREPA